MQIYIFKNNEQFGPFDAAQIEEYIKTSVFAMEDFAWSEGEPEWIALSDLLLKQSQMPDYKGVDTVPSPIEIEAQQEAEAKVLTAEIAERFLKDNDSVDLSHFTSIKDNAAQILANHNEELELNGLVILSATAAKALAQHKGDFLSFDALASLSDAVAEALAQHRGFLWLNGLTSLSNAAAEALAQHKGWLSFNGLTSLSDAAAQALAQHSNESEEVSLSLNGLTSLSNAAAQALAQHGGPLDLNGLKSLSDFAAQALAQHQAGWLSLNGLTLLSDGAAAALAQHKGRGLDLSGLTNLSDTAARALMEYQKYKSIAVTKYVRSLLEKDKADFEAKTWAANMRSSIDKAQAQVEAKPAEIQSAPQVAEIKILTKNIAKQFVKDNDSIDLGEFTVIEPAAAQVLAKHKGKLNLSGLTSLSDKSAMELSKHKGLLVLVNLASLSNTGAEALVQSKWSGNHTSLIASKNVEMTLVRAKTRVEAKLQAQAQARAKEKALAEARAQAAAKASEPMSDKAICGIWCLSSIIVCVITWFWVSSFNYPVSDADKHLNFLAIATAFISTLSSLISLMVLGNWENGGAPSNETIALIQRQQMINKLNDIRNDLNDE